MSVPPVQAGLVKDFKIKYYLCSPGSGGLEYVVWNFNVRKVTAYVPWEYFREVIRSIESKNDEAGLPNSSTK